MSIAFVKITARMHSGLEAIENLFFYEGTLPSGTEFPAVSLAAFGTSWGTLRSGDWMAGLPTDCFLDNVYVEGYRNTGEPGLEQPQQVIITNNGVVTPPTRDGNQQTLTLHPDLGALVTLASTPGTIRRAYWAYGPAVSAFIADDGTFNSAAMGSTAINAVRAAAIGTVTDGTTTLTPIKVSFTLGHLPTPNITAYRVVVGANFRSKARVRRSRMNSR